MPITIYSALQTGLSIFTANRARFILAMPAIFVERQIKMCDTFSMRTKKPMVTIAVRIKESDLQLLRSAATKCDESQSEIVREALREKTSKILLSSGREPQAA